jgi:hypothetical protein
MPRKITKAMATQNSSLNIVVSALEYVGHCLFNRLV